MHHPILATILLGLICVGGSFLIDSGLPSTAWAADVLKIDGLSSDPKQFRTQVDQLVSKADSLIDKLQGNPQHQAIVLDLLQTRDDILRETPKIDSAPGDAKWTTKDMRESVESKLKLLKEQYDKAAASAS